MKAVFLFLTLLACGAPPPSTSKLDAQMFSRWILGPAQSWETPDFHSPAHRRELREYGWRIFQKLTRPTGLQQLQGEVPAWMTFYDLNDVDRLTLVLKDNPRHSEESRESYWNRMQSVLARQVESSPFWSEQRIQRYLARYENRPNNLNGLERTFYSASLTARILQSAPAIIDCSATQVPLKPITTSINSCLPDTPDRNDVALKTSWRRLEETVSTPTTTKESLAQIIKAPNSESGNWDTWQEQVAVPPQAERFTQTTLSGAEFMLMGLHAMVRVHDDWLWLTWWWSDQADEDFGSDRPQSLPQPWNQFKMCITDRFDGTLGSGFPEQSPLGQLHQVLNDRDTSWCSNPHIELEPGNASTNCIGCHQHAGSGRSVQDVTAAPWESLDRQAENFPADYLWSLYQSPLVGKLRQRLGNEF